MSFYYNGATATAIIADAAGNWRTPKTLRVRFYSDGGWGTNYGAEIDLSNLKFYKDY